MGFGISGIPNEESGIPRTIASAILVPLIKNQNLVNGIRNPSNAESKAVLDFITWSRSRQMIAGVFFLYTKDFYLKLTACFIYFLQVNWLTVAAQGPVVGFFRGGGGRGRAHAKNN